MSEYKVHCADCKRLLGEEFGEVHEWLDEFFMLPKYGTHHRKVRHNQKGVEEVKAKWGIRAAWAAEIHIKRDLKEEGYDGDIPKDEEEYKKLDLW